VIDLNINMLNEFTFKILNVFVALHIKLSPFFNRFLFRLKGVTFGKNMCILGKINVVGSGKITIGDNFMMTNGHAINPISSNMQGVFYTESGGVISVGDNVGMSSTRMWIRNRLNIGNNVNIGAYVLLIDTDSHQMDYRMRRRDASSHFSKEELQDNINSAPITIEDDVWIGAHSIVLKGVTIGARSIIGAGSVVTKSIPADYVAAGNPCRVIRKTNG